MIKTLLTIILPLVLPVVVYGIYLQLARRKARLKQEGRLPAWQDAPWSMIVLSGCLLLGATLLTVRFMDEDTIDGTYQPPRIVDGQIEEGHVEQ